MSISNVDQQLVDEIKSLMTGVLGNSTLVKSEIMGDLPTDLVDDFVSTYCTDGSNRGLEIPIYFAFPTTPPKTAFLLVQYKGSVEDEDSSSLGGIQGGVQDKEEGPVIHEKVAFTYYPDKHALVGTTQSKIYSINSIPQLAIQNITFDGNTISILDVNDAIGSMFDGIKTTDVYYSEYLEDKKSDILPIGINTNEGVTIDFIASNTNTIRCLSALFLYIQIYLRHTIAENYNVYDPKIGVSGMDAIENLQNQGDPSQQLYYRRLTITYKVTQVISQSMAEKIEVIGSFKKRKEEIEDMTNNILEELKKLKDETDATKAQIDANNIITRQEFNKLANKIDERLSSIKQNIECFANLADLKAQYPNGKDGIFVTNDNNHKYQYKNGTWVDEGVWTITTFDPETKRKIASLDTSDAITKNVLQKMTDTVIDIQWFVGTIDSNTGVITPKEQSVNAYSSLKKLEGKPHIFGYEFNSNIKSIAFIEFDSDGKLLSYNASGANGTYAPSAEANTVRFQITSASNMIEQNDLRNFISTSALTITDYGQRSILNDLNNLYIRERLTPLTAIAGKTINTNVDYYEPVDVSILSSAPGYQVVNKPCAPGDVFVINSLKGGVNARGWAFLDQQNRLLQKSLEGIIEDQVTLYAPSQAGRLVVNSMDPNCAVFQYTPDTDQLARINLAQEANINHNIKLAFDIGETISLVPEYVANYRYLILDCEAGDEFRIKGVGGNNPRLYGFLTADNHLIEVAKPNLDASNGQYIKAPILSKKLVVNFNKISNYPVELYKIPIGTIEKQNYKDQEKKFLVVPPVDLAISSYINGISLGKDLSNYLADFAKTGDKMVHVSTFYKVADTLYMSYYANTRTSAEDPTKHTARLVYAPFNDLSQQTYIDVADIGQDYNGQTIDAIYDSLLLKTSNDSYMIYAFTAKVGGKFYMLYRRFDPKTRLFSDIHTMNFKVGNLLGTFDTVSVHDMLSKIGINYNYEDHDISFIQKLSQRVEDGVVQYYAGIGILHFCFVAKSSDLINWTFVSAPNFNYQPEFEPSVYVKGDNVYYFCRQQGTEGSAVLSKFDLTSNTWSNPILVPDTQSRSDFFEWNNNLYLVHAPLDRDHISLMQIDQNILEKSHEVATAKVQDCFYPFTQNIDGQMYMSFTQSRRHIWLTKFNPHKLSDNDVTAIFSKLLG